MIQGFKRIVASGEFQVLTLLFVLLGFFVPRVCHESDCGVFRDWCIYVSQHGISQIYNLEKPVVNYPPLMFYVLKLFGWWNGSAEVITQNFRWFKLVSLAADFATASLVLLLVKNLKNRLLFLLLLIANPVFIYNSYIWGQVDAILMLLVFAAFFCVVKKRLAAGVVMFVLALNFKMQAIIFLLPLLLFALQHMQRKTWMRDLATMTIAGAATLLLLWLPFFLYGDWRLMLKSIVGAVDMYPSISHSAFNFWALLLPIPQLSVSDQEMFAGIKFKHLGLLLFATAYLLAALPAIVTCFRKMVGNKAKEEDTKQVLAMFALVPLCFFFFNTQMHERYSHPALVFVALYSFTTTRLWLFALVCLAYFSNVEGMLGALGFPNYKVLLFQPKFGAALFAVLILSMFFFLYKDFLKSNHQRERKIFNRQSA